MKKCIVTVLGKDTVGIIARVCTYLAENGINILDISQTIVQGYFNMMMIVDVSNLKKDFTDQLYFSRLFHKLKGYSPREYRKLRNKF